MNGFIDWIAKILLSKHWEPAEVEGATQVKAGCHAHALIVWHVRSQEFSFSSRRLIALSRQSQYVTKGLVTKTRHELNCVVTSVVDVTI